MSQSETHDEVGGAYARYVLFVLILVYIFNFIDRQILSILAEEIKADLGITDAQMGFLYGTAFAVFYAIFGIPLGRLADLWTRKSLISAGLGFWSLMTALSGTARSFFTLSFYRIGVGIGEASATPAAFSMLSDYFPVRMRATVLALYSTGVYIGAGIGIFLGGWVVDAWGAAYPNPAEAPFGLKGWQAAFFIVGLPGVILSLWVWTLREPKRGQSEGIETPQHPAPFKEFGKELLAVIPPLTLFSLYSTGASTRTIVINLLSAVGLALAAWGLIILLGADSTAQWVAMAIGLYAAVSWAQGLALRDPPTFAMIFHSKALLYVVVAFPCIAFVTYGAGFWAAPYFIRAFGVSEGEVGMILGLSAAVGGLIGVTMGGVLSDKLKQTTPYGRLYIGLGVVVFSVPSALILLTTSNIYVAYIANFFFSIFSPMWIGPAASTVNDLVMPRMRAMVSAFYLLMVTFIGLALGPYTMGQISTFLERGGMSSSDSLRWGMMLGLSTLAITVICLLMAMRYLKEEEETRLERAHAAGEPGINL